MIRVGICGWTEKTLIQSREFYPPSAKTAEARLRFYAQHFDVVEVDSSYYAIPAMQTVGLWAERTPEGFIFHIKAFAGLTGHGVDPRSLPSDLQDLLTSEQREERHVYLKDPAQIAPIAARFRQNLEPLAAAGKLGVLVYQFPPWFHYSHGNLDHIVICKNLMPGLPLAVEFRHGSWLVPGQREVVLSFLRDNGLHYVTADEPQFGDLRTIPCLPRSTGDVAYFRYHGRNRENWFRKGVETALRYAYEYSDEELRGFVSSINEVAEKAKVTYVMFNNCYMASAIRNALRMKDLVKK
jgi:uncharacterized protein YecE (DUF72 family)